MRVTPFCVYTWNTEWNFKIICSVLSQFFLFKNEAGASRSIAAKENMEIFWFALGSLILSLHYFFIFSFHSSLLPSFRSSRVLPSELYCLFSLVSVLLCLISPCMSFISLFRLSPPYSFTCLLLSSLFFFLSSFCTSISPSFPLHLILKSRLKNHITLFSRGFHSLWTLFQSGVGYF